MYVIPRHFPETGVVPDPEEQLQDVHFAAAHTTVLGEVPHEPAAASTTGEVVIEPHEIPALRQRAVVTGHVAVRRILESQERAVGESHASDDEAPSEPLTVTDQTAVHQLWLLAHETEGVEVTVARMPDGTVPTLGAGTKDNLGLGQPPMPGSDEATMPLFTHQVANTEMGSEDTTPSLELPGLGTVHFSEPAPNPLSITQEKAVGMHTRHTRALGRMARRAVARLSSAVRRVA